MKEIEIFHPVSFSEKDGDKKKSEVQKTIEEWGDLLTVFPNNYGINLCAIKGLYVTRREDNQISQIRIVLMPCEDEDINESTKRKHKILKISESNLFESKEEKTKRLLENAKMK